MSDVVQKLWGFCHTLRHDGIDYGDYIVHVFSEKARAYYDIERLWRGAKEVTPPAARKGGRAARAARN